MINQTEWLRTRKNLLDEVKSQVLVRLGDLPAALKRYSHGLEEEFKDRWQACDAEIFRRSINQAQIVLGGDFHAYSQSQKAHLRVLRDHVQRESVVLALECLAVEHEAAAAAFLADDISEEKFLKVCDWQRNWGFPWEHYRPLFELARDRGFRIRGLNRTNQSSLKLRDEWSAKRIHQFLKEDPQVLVYVVVGEWHVARTHLPKYLRQRIKAPGALVVLFQDVEKLYFQLARSQRDGQVEFLKSSHGRFCLMVSPPWMKWQSYLMYLEQAYDQDLQEDLAVDYSDHVASLIQLLASDLRVSISKAAVQVFCPSSKTSLNRQKVSLPKRLSRALVYHFEHGLSFYLPEKQWLYLSRPTINHASALAGQYVHARLSDRQRTMWDVPKDFLPLIWVEALGFFFSKWINPKRKAETLESLRLQLSARNPKDKGRQALLLALDHRLSEVLWVKTGRLRKPRYKPRELAAYFDAARILGSMLGERLFQKVRSRTISLTQLMSYLKMNIENKKFAGQYWELIRELEFDQVL